MEKKIYNKTALIIMDGWGKELDPKRSAIFAANTPNIDKYYKKYSNATLITYGNEVGLPKDQMGNSEVGHTNLGAGRIVYQDLVKINKAVETNSLAKNKTLLETFNYCLENNKALHLMGLVSDGGVHSHINHLIAICNYASNYGLKRIYIHAFTDGRDCSPNSGIEFIKTLEQRISNSNAKIVSIIGRYYAMDRDNRWDRIQKAYDLLVHGKGEQFFSAEEAINHSYLENVTDEFITPKTIVNQSKISNGKIEANDAVICFNYRTDRCREITTALTQEHLHEYNMSTLPLKFVTMTKYDDSFNGIDVLFDKNDLTNTIGEVLSNWNKTQLRIAETEKYPHVTFFFSGGREKLFKDENRKVIPSPKVATYDLQPEMSANIVMENAIKEIQENEPDFICLNFANTDMVGHTGVFSAAVKAAETVDNCVKKVIEQALEKDYAIILTADHGNADIMLNTDGSVHTSHTKNLVPVFFISNNDKRKIKNGKLADIAPTLLYLMGIEIPAEMTGNILI